METAWAITAAVVPTAIGIGFGIMLIASREYQIGAGWAFALSGVWLGGVGFMWLIHTPSSVGWRIAAGMGIGAFVFVITPLLIRAAWPVVDAHAQSKAEGNSVMSQEAPPDGRQPPIVNQGPGSAFSYGQQGGITAGTVNIAPARVPFTSELKADLLQKLKTNKPIELMTVGNNEDQKIGDEVLNFLKANGYQVPERMVIGMLAPPPNGPYSLEEKADKYVVTIAPSAR
jgi:hypothetical protein